MISGEITNIGISKGKNAKGPWTRWEFELDGDKKYSTFDKNIGEKFDVGQFVKIEGKKDGKFFNMTNMKEIDGEDTSPKETKESARNPVEERLKLLEICKNVAIYEDSSGKQIKSIPNRMLEIEGVLSNGIAEDKTNQDRVVTEKVR